MPITEATISKYSPTVPGPKELSVTVCLPAENLNFAKLLLVGAMCV